MHHVHFCTKRFCLLLVFQNKQRSHRCFPTCANLDQLCCCRKTPKTTERHFIARSSHEMARSRSIVFIDAFSPLVALRAGRKMNTLLKWKPYERFPSAANGRRLRPSVGFAAAVVYTAKERPGGSERLIAVHRQKCTAFHYFLSVRASSMRSTKKRRPVTPVKEQVRTLPRIHLTLELSLCCLSRIRAL